MDGYNVRYSNITRPNFSMPDKDFFQQLREHTSVLHNELEGCYPFATMMQPDKFSIVSYTDTLRIMSGFHFQLASLPFHTSSINFPDFLRLDQVCKSVDSDLSSLAAQGENTATIPFILPFTVDENEKTTAKLVASAYVWIGSSMGAKIISRWLEQSHSELPGNYYQQMKAVGSSWYEFKRSVATCCGTPEDLNKAGDYAGRLFQSLIHSAQQLPSGARKSARSI